MFLQVGNINAARCVPTGGFFNAARCVPTGGLFNAARCVPTKRGMDDYKNRLYCLEYSLFSYDKIYFFLLVFFLAFA